ncbi:DCC1-like thiol-disulfide oxidoreductase family protein [Rhizobium sp. ZPR3]|uniref:DCC1-like thiol-disulfide oxidoreductase family protein n=2 Tax=unclassified Rhizobium TaxID=2613769 RepID=A0AAU7S9L6_9HYPH
MIVVFDTECILCSRAVDFILKREAGESITFAAATSVHAEPILAQFAKISIGPNETLLVISGGKLLTCSSAVVEIASHLRFPWNLAMLICAEN